MSGMFKKLRGSETGIASLMVTMVLMIVISLIVLGFAQVARREQRQTLDRQLSSQAYYAAETGVNDAVDAIKAAVASGDPSAADKQNCQPDTVASSPYNVSQHDPNIDPAHNVSYTCLRVSTTADSLHIIPVHKNNGNAINTDITITWPSQTGIADSGDCAAPILPIKNPQATDADWPCGFGVIRLDLVPTSDNNGNATPAILSRQALAANDMVVYLYPSNTNGGSVGNTSYYVSGTTVRQGDQVSAACVSNGKCSVSIGLPPPPGPGFNTYYARLRMMYRGTASDVIISPDNNQATFAGAQAVVDATGKAQDVLRRIQVYVPLSTGNTNYSPFATQTRDSICKRFAVAPGPPATWDAHPVVAVNDNQNPLCQ
jgi:hypothetical protein